VLGSLAPTRSSYTLAVLAHWLVVPLGYELCASDSLATYGATDIELGHWVAGSQNVTQFHVYGAIQMSFDCLID